MNSPRAFHDEVARQLESDILSFGWLRQLAESSFTGPDKLRGEQAAFDVVSSLVDSGIAVVGDARIDGSSVAIRAWSERGEVLKKKMALRVNGNSPEEQDWAFWLQLERHYNTG